MKSKPIQSPQNDEKAHKISHNFSITPQHYKNTGAHELQKPPSPLFIHNCSPPPLQRTGREKSNDWISRRRIKKNSTNQENKSDLSSKVSSHVASIIAASVSLPRGTPSMIASGKLNPSENRKRFPKKDKNPMDKRFCRLTKGSTNDDDSRSENQSQEVRKSPNKKSAFVKSISFLGLEIAINVGNPAWQIIKWDSSKDSWEEYESESNTGCPSKFLIMCLNSIQNAVQQKNGAFSSDGDRPLFANAWGLEFWNCFTNGNDVLDINGGDSTVEKIGWITSTAADTISMKEKEGLSFNGPFLLYLVPSQDKAYKVRQICKHLEVVGIRTMCLHSGASIDHQIHSLKSYEPEFLVSTPERLLELLSLKAVVDGLEAPFKGTTYFDAVESIRKLVSGNPQIVVFCEC